MPKQTANIKKFIFDRLVDRQNICGLQKQRININKLIKQRQNIVIYAKRNYGKTSLVKNIIIDDFKQKYKKPFIFFVDLMGVKDMDSIESRLKSALENAIKEAFPIKSFANSVGDFLTNLKASISFDPATSMPVISVESLGQLDNESTIEEIFLSLNNISEKFPSLIVLDEFQDIANVDEAESIFRNSFQQMQSVPIIVLGSKQHMLRDIFAMPNSPLANFGHDITINEIDYHKYHQYIEERFSQKKLKISPSNAEFLQNIMQRQPEAINLLCYEIYQSHSSINVDKKIIIRALDQILDQRNKRFEVMLYAFSKAEEKIIIAIAKNDWVSKPQSKEFSAQVDLTPRAIKMNIDKLIDKGILEIEDGPLFDAKYSISDPLLKLYLQRFR